MPPMNADPHEVLGVEKDATPDAIKTRYRLLARRYHPDVNDGDRTAEWAFKKIHDAYEAIQNQQNAPDAPTATPDKPPGRTSHRHHAAGRPPRTPEPQPDPRHREFEEDMITAGLSLATGVIVTSGASWTGLLTNDMAMIAGAATAITITIVRCYINTMSSINRDDDF